MSGILHQKVHRSEVQDKTCISPVWRSKKIQSRINRSRAASQVRINAPFRNELNALPCGQFGHKGPPLPTMVLPLNRLKREKLQYTSSQEKSLPPKGKPKKPPTNLERALAIKNTTLQPTKCSSESPSIKQ